LGRFLSRKCGKGAFFYAGVRPQGRFLFLPTAYGGAMSRF
jgi:hypothetical protein